MSTPRFVIYANDPWALNYYSPQLNTADTADKTYEGSVLQTQEAVTTALDTTTTMLVNAPFTHIVMGFFEFANNNPNSPWYNYETPVLTWNGQPLTQMNTPSTWTKAPNQPWGISPNVASCLKQIIASGKILITSMQQDADLPYIENMGYDKFYSLFSEQVLAPFGFSGIDLDMESQWGEYPAVLIGISNTFGQNGNLVTHAPYGTLDCQGGWENMLNFYLCSIKGQNDTPLVGQTVIQSGGQNVNSISWLNIQYYSGGDQGNAKETLSQYVLAASTAGAIPNAGIAEPDYFNVAGFACVIADPQYELWNQFQDAEAEKEATNGTIQCDPCNSPSGVYVMDTINGLVTQYGKDKNGLAQFGGVFIYSYRYYTSSQVGYTYQVNTWNAIATAMGLIQAT